MNKIVHEICVPLIVLSAMAFLAYWRNPLDGVVPKDVLDSVPVPVNGALLVWAMYAVFYVVLSVPLGVLASAIMFGMVYGVDIAVARFPTETLYAAIVVHIVAWVLQIYAHYRWEKRAPALMDNLFQALFVAPLFVLIQYLLSAGFLADFEKAIRPEVSRRIRDFKAKEAEKSK
jgi:uncharacterized membrane protein YGL010W